MCYSWRLRGHQNRWSRFRAESEAVYAGLAPGEYGFEVRAMDRNGRCSAPARLALSITPDLQADRIQALAGALSQGARAEQFIGQGSAIRSALEQMQTMAGSQVRVLIAGETGTGKGLAARAMHALSQRPGPFIQVNCGAIPAGLIESELFGHERGAFTGATARKLGCFEVAQGGTLFLDEIGDLPLESQAVLLEVLQEGSFQRVGGREPIRAEARVIAATNRDLQQAVAQGLFRMDLFYRLNGFTLQLPPLRERREDIPVLVQLFVRRIAQHLNRTPPALRPEVLALLQHYAWPGNVRELEHLAQRAVLLCKGGFIEVEDLPLSVVQGEEVGAMGFVPLEEYERAYIEKALEAARGVIYGERGAAAGGGPGKAALADAGVGDQAAGVALGNCTHIEYNCTQYGYESQQPYFLRFIWPYPPGGAGFALWSSPGIFLFAPNFAAGCHWTGGSAAGTQAPCRGGDHPATAAGKGGLLSGQSAVSDFCGTQESGS
ncbi:MAG: sigma 54-interacting transcriptional regulator [Chloroflexi bacterium]|nr:sigma 54-interacting transcriptional regulator [Chloroflexota bacterium]